MFVYKSSLTLATIASSIPNNLSLCFSNDEYVLADTLAVIHDSYVNIIPITSTSRRSKYIPIHQGNDRNAGFIKQVKWVEINNENYFIVVSTNGMQIYDHEIGDVVYYHACRETGDERSYVIGICVLKKNVLCVGTHLGTVWMFEHTEKTNTFKVINRVYAHDEAVSILEANGKLLCSSSYMTTYLWTFKERDFEIIRKLTVLGLDAKPTVIKFKFGFVVVAYESGEFCIFDVNDEEVQIRTVAHKLAITGLDFSGNCLIATASIDCNIKLWNLKQQNNEVTLLQTIFNEEGPLYGIGFLNFSCTEFCAVTGEDINVKFYISWENNFPTETTT